MIKPDGVQRNIVGEIIARFEKKGYKLAALKVDERLMKLPSRPFLEVFDDTNTCTIVPTDVSRGPIPQFDHLADYSLP